MASIVTCKFEKEPGVKDMAKVLQLLHGIKKKLTQTNCFYD
jgi:hypothetical protein